MITSILDVRIAPEHVEGAPAAIEETLADTRAFDGCLGVDILVDVTDAAHFVLLERWESLEHDDAYRAWRATGVARNRMREIAAEPPILTRLDAVVAS